MYVSFLDATELGDSRIGSRRVNSVEQLDDFLSRNGVPETRFM
jgi:hypothetical protein